MTRFALDYDNTYTVDPGLWNDWVANALMRGHEVYMVTARDERHDRTPAIQRVEDVLGIPIVWCRGIAKRWYCLHFGPGHIDVWIDDKPEAILANSTTSPEDLTTWRATHRWGHEE